MIFRFENFSLDGDRRELRRGSEIISIEPQVFDVLEFLIANRQRVVSNDDLIKKVWQGRIVSDGTVATRINAVRSAIGDSGREQRLVRTVARKGYRFAGEIHQEHDLSDRSNDSAASLWPETLGDRPSIAVLPFTNFSGDGEQTYFADGMVDEINTALSRIKWLFVIARTSSFTYRDRVIDVRQIGRELGVRYVLKAAYGKSRIECASWLSSSMPKPAGICGRTALMPCSTIFLIYRMSSPPASWEQSRLGAAR